MSEIIKVRPNLALDLSKVESLFTEEDGIFNKTFSVIAFTGFEYYRLSKSNNKEIAQETFEEILTLINNHRRAKK